MCTSIPNLVSFQPYIPLFYLYIHVVILTYAHSTGLVETTVVDPNSAGCVSDTEGILKLSTEVEGNLKLEPAKMVPVNVNNK